jgi:hypothetical protein
MLGGVITKQNTKNSVCVIHTGCSTSLDFAAAEIQPPIHTETKCAGVIRRLDFTGSKKCHDLILPWFGDVVQCCASWLYIKFMWKLKHVATISEHPQNFCGSQDWHTRTPHGRGIATATLGRTVLGSAKPLAVSFPLAFHLGSEAWHDAGIKLSSWDQWFPQP